MDYDKIISQSDHISDTRVRAAGPWSAGSKWHSSYCMPLTYTTLGPYLSPEKVNRLLKTIPAEDLEKKYASEAMHVSSKGGAEVGSTKRQLQQPGAQQEDILAQGAAPDIVTPRRAKKVVGGANAANSSANYNILADTTEVQPAWSVSEWRKRMQRGVKWEKITRKVSTHQGRDNAGPVPVDGEDYMSLELPGSARGCTEDVQRPSSPQPQQDPTTEARPPAKPSQPPWQPQPTRPASARAPARPAGPHRPSAQSRGHPQRPQRPVSAVQSRVRGHQAKASPRAARPRPQSARVPSTSASNVAQPRAARQPQQSENPQAQQAEFRSLAALLASCQATGHGDSRLLKMLKQNPIVDGPDKVAGTPGPQARPERNSEEPVVTFEDLTDQLLKVPQFDYTDRPVYKRPDTRPGCPLVRPRQALDHSQRPLVQMHKPGTRHGVPAPPVEPSVPPPASRQEIDNFLRTILRGTSISYSRDEMSTQSSHK